MRIIDTERIPIKLWLDDIEPGALEQAKHVANLPFAFHHVAIMPDAHEGFGMPIGGVLAAIGHVVPNAVGVDIGCGMCAVPTQARSMPRSQLTEIIAIARRTIPTGFKRHEQAQDESVMPELKASLPIVRREYESAKRQVGTLGGGNHFLEIQQGSDGRVWLMAHSGSRNIGKQVADHYNRLAMKQNDTLKLPLPRSWQLCALGIETAEGISYMQEMRYCVEFALANRRLMVKALAEIFEKVAGQAVLIDGLINIAHNYAAKEMHYGRETIVHRKGATRAAAGEAGIIPGSQGSASYIVRGLGNPESFSSCSHGAGRKLGRKEAERSLSFEDETARLDRLGVLHALRARRDLDEAPGAYKDIDVVMQNQKDLVEIVTELKPLAVIKG